MKKLFLSLLFVGLVSARSPVQADTLGQREAFNVNSDYDDQGRTSLNATLRYVSDSAYFYVDDAAWTTFTPAGQADFLNDVKALASEFDTVIHPREREFYGTEPDPGVDEDSHVVILLESLRRGSGGYFDATNVYTRNDFSDSNEHEMIVVSIDAVAAGFVAPFLAHEFQHLISVNQKEFLRGVSEDVWLNEVRSEYAISLSGYNRPYAGSSLESRVAAFLRTPSDSLTEWPNVSQDYASAALFGEYLAGRYGQNILRDTLQMPARGIDSLNRYFASHNIPERFAEVFSDWMIANYINDGSTRFSYANSDLRSLKVTPQYRNTVWANSSDLVFSSLRDWQPVWQEFVMGESGVGLDRAVKLVFATESDQNFLVSYVIFYSDGSYDVERMSVGNGTRTAYLLSSDLFNAPQPGDKSITKVLVALTKTQKTQNFSGSESEAPIRTSFSLISKETAQAAVNSGATFNSRVAVVRDGALIKRNNGEQDVYVIWGPYKRYLSPEVIRLYGHLDPASAIPVNDTVFNSYTTSNYVRAVDTEPVYATWPDNTKHWFNISAAQWDATRRDWNAIFIINEAELSFYKTGAHITE